MHDQPVANSSRAAGVGVSILQVIEDAGAGLVGFGGQSGRTIGNVARKRC